MLIFDKLPQDLGQPTLTAGSDWGGSDSLKSGLTVSGPPTDTQGGIIGDSKRNRDERWSILSTSNYIDAEGKMDS